MISATCEFFAERPRLSLKRKVVAVVVFLSSFDEEFFSFLCKSTSKLILSFSRSVCWINIQGVSPLYVGLNPGPHHLASALHHLLLANKWLPVTLIVDDSLDAQKIRQVVQQHPSDVDKVMSLLLFVFFFVLCCTVDCFVPSRWWWWLSIAGRHLTGFLPSWVASSRRRRWSSPFAASLVWRRSSSAKPSVSTCSTAIGFGWPWSKPSAVGPPSRLRPTGRWACWASFRSNRSVWPSTRWKDRWPFYIRPSGPVCPSNSCSPGSLRGTPLLLSITPATSSVSKWPKSSTGKSGPIMFKSILC